MSKHMKWGISTWVFLHTLSVSIHEEHYKQKRYEVMNLLKHLFSALPCPDCAAHASQYIKNVVVPETKPLFIKWLVDFHNSVNGRLLKAQFPLDQINKYKTVSLTDAFHACMTSILQQPYNPRLIMTKIKTAHCLKQIYMWLGQQLLIKK